MGTRTHGTTALQYQIVPSRTRTTMARVMPVTRMTTTTESLTVGTTVAWCPTQTRKTQTVRQRAGPVVGLRLVWGPWQVWAWLGLGRGCR